VTGSASQFPVQAQCRLEAVWITIDIAIIPPARDTLAQGVGSGSHLVCRRGMQRHKKSTVPDGYRAFCLGVLLAG
jgi:hypothetical protein